MVSHNFLPHTNLSATCQRRITNDARLDISNTPTKTTNCFEHH